MISFWQRILKALGLGQQASQKQKAYLEPLESTVDLERFQHLLEYASRRSLCGRSTPRSGRNWIGSTITIQAKRHDFRAHVDTATHKAGDMVTILPYVGWSWHPHHLSVHLVDGSLEFRASHSGNGASIFSRPAANREDVAEIKKCFDFWYEEFDLPNSLQRPTYPKRKFEPTGEALLDIRTYLQDGSIGVFHELFKDDDPVIWVDRGEEDDRIVALVAGVLGLVDLEACFDNDTCDLQISYRGIEHRVHYPLVGIADRDTTIIALNQILQPDHELRVCTASRGSDTLALMALSASMWSQIEAEHPKECAACFTVITDGTIIFG